MNAKKQAEENVLRIAARQGLKQKGVSKQIAKLISAPEVRREQSERPDFVKLYSPQDPSQPQILVGIEHFRVDMNSIQPKNKKGEPGKIQASGAAREKHAIEVFNKWHGADIMAAYDEVMKDISKVVELGIKDVMTISYNNYLASFKHSLDEHLEKINAYKATLNQIDSKIQHRMILLIEIHTDFQNLYYYNLKKGIFHDDKVIPMFEDVVKMLEQIDPRSFDYVVLCFDGLIMTPNASVVCLPVRNIRKHLEKQNVEIYEYAGHDKILPAFVTKNLSNKATVNHEYFNDETTLLMSYEGFQLDKNLEQLLVRDAFAVIGKCIKEKKNFATTSEVQQYILMLMENFLKDKGMMGETK